MWASLDDQKVGQWEVIKGKPGKEIKNSFVNYWFNVSY